MRNRLAIYQRVTAFQIFQLFTHSSKRRTSLSNCKKILQKFRQEKSKHVAFLQLKRNTDTFSLWWSNIETHTFCMFVCVCVRCGAVSAVTVYKMYKIYPRAKIQNKMRVRLRDLKHKEDRCRFNSNDGEKTRTDMESNGIKTEIEWNVETCVLNWGQLQLLLPTACVSAMVWLPMLPFLLLFSTFVL